VNQAGQGWELHWSQRTLRLYPVLTQRRRGAAAGTLSAAPQPTA